MMMQMLDSVIKNGEMIKLDDVMKYAFYYGNVQYMRYIHVHVCKEWFIVQCVKIM